MSSWEEGGAIAINSERLAFIASGARPDILDRILAIHRDLSRLKLRQHPSASASCRTRSERFEFWRNLRNQWNCVAILRTAKIRRLHSKEPVNVCQKDQRIHVQAAHDQRRQPVIVAEGRPPASLAKGFDLSSGDSVVFIDNGKHL